MSIISKVVNRRNEMLKYFLLLRVYPDYVTCNGERNVTNFLKTYTGKKQEVSVLRQLLPAFWFYWRSLVVWQRVVVTWNLKVAISLWINKLTHFAIFSNVYCWCFKYIKFLKFTVSVSNQNRICIKDWNVFGRNLYNHEQILFHCSCTEMVIFRHLDRCAPTLHIQ